MEILVNQLISSYLVYLSNYFGIYLVMGNSFPIKVSRSKAILWGFICSNFVSIISAVLCVFINHYKIHETFEMKLLYRIITLIGESIMVAYLHKAVKTPWYRIYWVDWLVVSVVISFFSKVLYIDRYLKYSDEFITIKLITWNNLPDFLFSTLIIQSICVTVLIILIRWVRNHVKSPEIPVKIWIIVNVLLGILILSINKGYTAAQGEAFHWTRGIGSFYVALVIILAVLVIFVITLYFIQRRFLLLENSMLKEQNELQYNNYLAMQQQETRVHQLYHDIGNHIRTIQILVENGEKEEAQKYTDNLLEEYKSIYKYYYCTNRIINAVLTDKAKQCERCHITADIDINIPIQLSIREIDLMSIFANLLDNAIEGCNRSTSNNHYIKVRASIVGDYLAVKVINNKKADEIIDKFHVTWKKDKKVHGQGTKILKEIVERYKGHEEFLDLGEEFSALVMLSISQDEARKEEMRIL